MATFNGMAVDEDNGVVTIKLSNQKGTFGNDVALDSKAHNDAKELKKGDIVFPKFDGKNEQGRLQLVGLEKNYTGKTRGFGGNKGTWAPKKPWDDTGVTTGMVINCVTSLVCHKIITMKEMEKAADTLLKLNEKLKKSYKATREAEAPTVATATPKQTETVVSGEVENLDEELPWDE